MESASGQIKIRCRQVLRVCILSAALCTASGPVASAGTTKTPGLIGVRFSKDCVSAVVESSQPVTSITAVFNNDRWEQLDGLPGIVSYVVKVGPGAAESGLAIATLYVDAHSRLQQDPLGIVPHKVGLDFECQRQVSSTATRGRG